MAKNKHEEGSIRLRGSARGGRDTIIDGRSSVLVKVNGISEVASGRVLASLKKGTFVLFCLGLGCQVCLEPVRQVCLSILSTVLSLCRAVVG